MLLTPNVLVDIYRGFNANSPYPSAQARRAAANVPGHLKHHLKNGRFGYHAGGLHWTHVLYLDPSADVRSAYNGLLNLTDPTRADTILVGGYPQGNK